MKYAVYVKDLMSYAMTGNNKSV